MLENRQNNNRLKLFLTQFSSESSLESPVLMRAKEGYNMAFLFNATTDQQPPVCQAKFSKDLKKLFYIIVQSN